MAWAYSAGVLTSTGATEGSPDLLSTGVDAVEAADAARGYRDGFVAWLNNVEVRAAGSWIRIDDDLQLEIRGSSFINPGNGGVIHGARSTLIINASTTRADGTLDFETGSSLVCVRTNPNDPNPRIVWRSATRHDYPTVLNSAVPAKIDIAGLDLYSPGANNSFVKAYFGLATTATVNNVRVFGATTFQILSSIYNDLYIESLAFVSESLTNTVTFNRPVFFRSASAPFSGTLRSCDLSLRNPTFLNNCWSGSVNFATVLAASRIQLLYTFQHSFKQGLTALQNIKVRYIRSLQSSENSPPWSAPANAMVDRTTDANGTFTAIDLLDAYREGTSTNAIERYNWTAKARSYDRRTAGETIFANRVLYQHSVNMAAGYSEEVQMLAVAGLTLTEVQAAALTGISFAASGATGGTVTVTVDHSLSDLWHYYRWWIAQFANFGSEDTWTFANDILNVGAWNFVVDGATIEPPGVIVTTGTVTFINGADYNVRVTDSSGTRYNPLITISNFPNGSKITIIFGGVPIDVALNQNAPYSYRFRGATPATVTVQVERTGFEKFTQDVPLALVDVTVFAVLPALEDADSIDGPDVSFRKRFAEDAAVLAILRAADTDANLREYVGRAMIFDFEILAWKDNWNAIVSKSVGTTPTLTDVNRWRSYANETGYGSIGFLDEPANQVGEVI